MAGIWNRIRLRRHSAVHVPGNKSSFRVRLEDRMLLCFLAGLMGGTVMVNLLSESLSSQAGYYVSLLDQNVRVDKAMQLELFYRILRERLGPLVFAWLLGLTVYGVWFFCLASAGAGAGIGIILSLLTQQKGLLGLPLYLASMFPQALFYVPAVCALFVWGSRKNGNMRFLILLILAAVIAAGSACETWLNPYFLQMIL